MGASAAQNHVDDDHDTTLTPSDTSNTDKEESEPLKRLRATVEENSLFDQPSTSRAIESSTEEDYDDKTPKVNSHGKMKTFKCKQCDFVAITKLGFWEHMRNHIKPEKLLTCPKCPFVTEYKHHLEYHLNNHTGAKPFKCDQCMYTCVNKSMLNSHKKSHSDVYQYRCRDCGYVTKYCHSLKVHLRKYRHEPAMVLNPDGTPNPLPVIDVYGTRRGPRNTNNRATMVPRPATMQHEEQPSIPQVPDLIQMMMAAPRLPFPYSFLGQLPALSNPLWLKQFADVAAAEPQNPVNEQPEPIPSTSSAGDGVLDLSKPVTTMPSRSGSYETYSSSSSSSEEEEEEKERENPPSEVVPEDVNNNNNNNRAASSAADEYQCPFCSIRFGDVVLYTMHMGYHGYNNPFTCNMCGEECSDKITFFLHIARTPHN